MLYALRNDKFRVALPPLPVTNGARKSIVIVGCGRNDDGIVLFVQMTTTMASKEFVSESGCDARVRVGGEQQMRQHKTTLER